MSIAETEELYTEQRTEIQKTHSEKAFTELQRPSEAFFLAGALPQEFDRYASRA